MSKTIEQFDFRLFKMRGGDRLPSDPIVEIVLDHWSSNRKDGTPIISPHLMTVGEIEHHIRALKKDLDSVGVKAKAALVLARAETRAIVSAKKR